jgi:tyrosyl-tRNA synthetase
MLRDIGRHFSVNRMLTMDSVRSGRARQEDFIEFNHMICQAYDFVELARRTGCNLQMGAPTNGTSGADLGRRMGTHQLFALTTPLLTTASGAKMGDAAGAVAQRGTVQPTISGSTGATPRTLTLAGSCVHDAAASRDRRAGTKGAEVNEAKKVLATEATALPHGRDKAEAAAHGTRDVRGGHGRGPRRLRSPWPS